MNDRDIVGGLAVLVISVVGLVASMRVPSETTTQFGGGFYPGFLSVCLGVCGLIILVEGVLKREKVPVPKFEWGKVLPVLGSLVLYCLLFPILDFRIVTAIFLAICMFAFGVRRPLQLMAVAIGGSLVVFYVFTLGFNVVLN
ncbi:MAG TPA: tripartite tricarboxylate transporter TctB family protein [Firmicutes bacterium]|nr:tripartite tricarboxylate transporter TctB family protein [Bacillota bacterium]